MPTVAFEHSIHIARPVDEVVAFIRDVAIIVPARYRCIPTGAVEGHDTEAAAGTEVRWTPPQTSGRPR